jgi:hypothetical protein
MYNCGRYKGSMSAYQRLGVCICVRACVYACVRVRVRVCACVCVRVSA